MKMKVMKFGGTSLADEASLQCALSKIKQSVISGYRVLVVVSAIGRSGYAYATDTLLSQIRGCVSSKEKDRLMSVGETISSIVVCDRLRGMNINAYALGNEELGFVSDDVYGNAQIVKTTSKDIDRLFRTCEVIVAPGFQAHTEDYHITTLGRGGSDYSAMLFAAVLGVREVYVYTDVDGVYDKDPKLYHDAVVYKEMSYEKIIKLVESGAKVMHLQSLHYAKDQGLRINISSTLAETGGTWIINDC